MSYLLDTNVLSELVRIKPNKNVKIWIESVSSEALHISVLTLGEIRKGVEYIKEKERKEKLRLWIEIELPNWFGQRILTVDKEVSERWGRLQHEMQRPIPAIDSLIAATALHHDLRMVTRNESDFQFPSLQLINPWK